MQRDPKKLVILKKLTAHLEGVTPTNGFQFDLSSGIYRNRVQFGAETPAPAVSILEAQRPDHGLDADENGQAQSEDWLLLVQGWVNHAEGDKNPTDEAYRLMADVQVRLGELIAIDSSSGNPQYPSVYMLENLIAGMRAGPGVCRAPAEGASGRSYFYLPLNLKIANNTTDPYDLLPYRP
ncbi:tail terminator [Burkholderia phage BcepNazgul]|uniref:Uncharacterized protein n=1 Tax=Burkholderia phage BcepNazgul TaxID=242861 RepID=Q6UYI7_9CAUD|nr:tail terminator [Burkholderia phage BcepNazgul]AAQ63354.2 hypothetical protein Nazgul54 [Burkholderia phage BcepNazgul]